MLAHLKMKNVRAFCIKGRGSPVPLSCCFFSSKKTGVFWPKNIVLGPFEFFFQMLSLFLKWEAVPLEGGGVRRLMENTSFFTHFVIIPFLSFIQFDEFLEK